MYVSIYVYMSVVVLTQDVADDQSLFALLVLLEDLDVPPPVFPLKSRSRHKFGSVFEE